MDLGTGTSAKSNGGYASDVDFEDGEDEEEDEVVQRARARQDRELEFRAAIKAAKNADRSPPLCALCFDGGTLLVCDGVCRRSFHSRCLEMSDKQVCGRTAGHAGAPVHAPAITFSGLGIG
jgi:hypothetical protein